MFRSALIERFSTLRFRAALAAVLTFLFLFVLATPQTFAGDEVAETKISGVMTERVRTISSYTKKMTDTITVKPAYGRVVRLYRYDPATGEWVKAREYTTANTKKAKLVITYPAEWRQHASSTWKIVAPQAKSKVVVDEKGKKKTTPVLAKAKVKVKVRNKLLDCKAGVVMDAATGKLVYDARAKSERKIASMTKMMTALLLVENRALSAKVKVSAEAAKTPYAMGLAKGDTVTAKNLLYSMMLPSSNDAATAVASELAGSTKAFCKLMNKRAKQLGCTATKYKNAHGLDSGDAHSTALDQAIIARYLMTSPQAKAVRTAVKTKKYNFKSKKKHLYKLENLDRLLWSEKYQSKGIKTGTTRKAGACFAGAFEVNGRTYITIVMGADGDAKRWENTKRLVRFTRYAVKKGLGEYEL